jgi:ABC-type glycerol-3-phosphate transport system substrate-binding protein
MLKRLLALIALATAIGVAACSPAATTAPTLAVPGATGTPAASELPLTSP